MDISAIEEELKALSGNNVEFYEKMTPNATKIHGVRVPALRKLAQKIAKDDYKTFLEKNPHDSFEMEMLHAFVIGYAKEDIGILIKHFEEFMPQVNNWAVNDALCQTFKICRKYPEETLFFLRKYYASKDEFEVRVVAVMLLSHFLEDKYIDEVLETLDGLYTGGNYYAEMGVAWAFATAMAKCPEKTLKYFLGSNRHIDETVYKKSIQKMRESYRVSKEIKDIFKQNK